VLQPSGLKYETLAVKGA